MRTCIIITAITILGVAACASSEETTTAHSAAPDVPVPDTTSLVVTISTPETTGRIFEFDSTASGWSGYVYEYISDNKGNAQITDKASIKPRLGWDDFEQMADFYKIYSLPNQRDIEGRKPVNQKNNVSFVFTIKRDGKTRQFTYINPANELNDYWQSANAFAFVAFLLDDFEIVR